MTAMEPSGGIAPHERRRRARQRTRQSAVAIDGELQVDCTIVDQSESGARLALRAELPGHFHLIRLKTGACHECRLVWRDAKHAGVAFITSYDLAASEDPRLRRLKLIWQRMNRR